jgi:hypothetical protein
MAKQPKPQPDNLDPLEESDESLDPWDIPDAKPSTSARLEEKPARDLEIQMRSNSAGEDEWEISYPDNPLRPPSQYDLRAREKRSRFLNILSRTGSLKKAAAQVKLSPRALMLAKNKYPDFAKNWVIALEIYNSFEVEESIRHRALDGVKKAVYFQGNIVGYEIIYDSGLTQFWTKANLPEKYGDKTNINISGNVNHGIAFMPARATDEVEWERRVQQTLEDQKRNMIDITPAIVDNKSVNVQPSGQTVIQR